MEKENKGWRWEFTLKLLTTLGAFATIIFGYHKYVKEQEQLVAERQAQETENLKQRKFALYKSFWEKRFELYSQMCDAAAVVTTKMGKISQGKTPPPTDEKGFWIFYYGSLSIVEDKKVEKEMLAFGELLKACEKKIAGGGKPDLDDVRRMKKQSLVLAIACRDSISEYWDDLGELDRVKLTEFADLK